MSNRKEDTNLKREVAAQTALCIVALACSVFGHEMPQLPDGTLPNTEVVTNVPLHVDAARLRSFGLGLQAECCVSNEVLVAVGSDADGDGDLSFGEAAFVFGLDCDGERPEAAGADVAAEAVASSRWRRYSKRRRHCPGVQDGARDQLAESGILSEILAGVSTNMWNFADGKERRLWPNRAPTDNHASLTDDFDFDLNFCSPGAVEGRIH